ncbi:MAG TPA: heavy metal translocating P-type ATPase metal-binding domain-containing protein [Stellaceae bacterium]|nr:heavy metal translocating P-type ATPase metal-binding domain-containing protein [Stellaceae bacterium]
MTLASAVIDAPALAFEANDRRCAHCGASVAAANERFCCIGCAGAYRLIEELGLTRYYATRTLAAEARAPQPPDEDATDLSAYAVAAADGTASLSLLVDGLHCAACVWLIESALKRQAAVTEARVTLTTRRLDLRWRGGIEAAAPLVALVQRLGYRLAPYDAERAAALTDDEGRRLLRALAIAGFAAGNVMLLSVAVWSGGAGDMGAATRDLLHWVSALIALPAVVFGGAPFFRSAWQALKHHRTNMDVPIAVGVVLTSAMSLYETIVSGPHAYFESVVMLLFFLLIGRYLDLRARGRARSAAQLLLALTTHQATVLDANGRVKRLAATAVESGEQVLVAPGERVPVDGRVVSGASAVDRSLIDGESTPALIAAGDRVLAGMVNLSAPLTLIVTATGNRTFLAEIVRLMEAAEQGRARLVALADRVARLYAPAVHGLALATFALWLFFAPWQQALLNAVAVLIITCPCALGLAVPAVQMIASGRLMQRGILLKSATALERLATVDMVVFDKTGTLTTGRLALEAADIAPDRLRLAAGLAAASRHPLSAALRRACPDGPAIDGVLEHQGAGLSAGQLRLGSRAFCSVASSDDDDRPELWLTQRNASPTRFTFRDELREDAATVIAALRRAGIEVSLLSGDRAPVVAALAARLGIADWRAEQTPVEKHAALAALTARGRKVLMVGDGLNDAPALAAAFVSMSPASAADVSQTAADVVFQGRSLKSVSETLAIARRSQTLVRENIALAIAYNALAVPLAMLGLVTPPLAAFAMASSSLIVLGNALRLCGSRA